MGSYNMHPLGKLTLLCIILNVTYCKNFLTNKISVIVNPVSKSYVKASHHHGFKKSKKGKNHLRRGHGKKEDGNDYQEVGWLNPCSFKKKGSEVNLNLDGCGADIKFRCDGGCISIHEALYDCQDVDTPSDLEYVKTLKDLCQRKAQCHVETSKAEKCTKQTDDFPMKLKIVYSCDGGTDDTKSTKIKCEAVGNR